MKIKRAEITEQKKVLSIDNNSFKTINITGKKTEVVIFSDADIAVVGNGKIYIVGNGKVNIERGL